MFHEKEVPVTDPSSSGLTQKENSIRITKAIGIFVAIALGSLILLLSGAFRTDPYIKATIDLEGSTEQGEKIFRINCVGCHGITAQGLLGPDLHEVTHRATKKEIINQIRQGKTPPMPSFQIEPQQTADILAYLESLD